ncbi:MAG: hypothetical protein COB02_07335 [Candidatus Cloacimonadota bacterium]|nr:MAG: hypothetical protein COB02_07335 [Candidatus Cloacimonadota bacterium]
MKLFIYYIIILNISFSNEIYYQTIWQIIDANEDIEISSYQDEKIKSLALHLNDRNYPLKLSFSLNICKKENYRLFLRNNELIIRKILNSLKSVSDLKEISYAFLAIYNNKQSKQDKLSNDVQEMYNIIYHLYHYSYKIQGRENV